MDNNAKLRAIIEAAVAEVEKDTVACIVIEQNNAAYFLFDYNPKERKATWTKDRSTATHFLHSFEATRFIERYMKGKPVFIVKAPIEWFSSDEDYAELLL